jgi:hypothetical protein
VVEWPYPTSFDAAEYLFVGVSVRARDGRGDYERGRVGELSKVQFVAIESPSDRGGWHAKHAAAGEFRGTLTFTNVSQSACQLSGWPRLQAVVSGVIESTLTTLVRQNAPASNPSTPVRLAPRKTASFNIYGADWDAVPKQGVS